MKTNYLALFILVFIFAISCKKQKDVTIDKIGAESYTPLSVGSYWIYDVSNIDTLGNATFLMIDSTYIESDTVLNGETYSVFRSSSSAFYQQLLRDSASYLVDEMGQKFFHPANFTDTLFKNIFVNFNNDTISLTYRIMRVPPGPASCIAGSFDALDAETTRELPLLNIETKSHYLYASGVGLVLRQDFPVFGKVRTYNLVRYHIEK